ncbi:MAG: T9SS type A sorting domain-containing protein [Chitinophagales bacterium]
MKNFIPESIFSNTILNLLGAILLCNFTSAQSVTQVADINPNGASYFSSVSKLKDHLYIFGADDGTHGREPWISDLTEAGTYLLKDVDPGSGNGWTGGEYSVVAVANNKWVLVLQDPINGYELNVTDGTEAGTTLIKDIIPGYASPLIQLLTPGINGKAFFLGKSDINNIYMDFWVTDGTFSGTIPLVQHANTYLSYYSIWNGIFYGYMEMNGVNNVVRSDGTVAGTYSLIPSPASGGYNLTLFNDLLFFVATDPDHGSELWRSDGTVAGTYMIKDISPGVTNSLFGSGFTKFNDKLLFAANNKWYSTDGSASGTMEIPIWNPNTAMFTAMLGVAENYFLVRKTGTLDTIEVWASDGTLSGGTLLQKYADPSSPGNVDCIFWGSVNNHSVYEIEEDETAYGPLRHSLWKTDGTAAGTDTLISYDWCNDCERFYDHMVTCDAIYFTQKESANSADMWYTDGITMTGIDLIPNKLFRPYLEFQDDSLVLIGLSDEPDDANNEPWMFSTNCILPTGTKENDALPDIQIFPNPAHEYLYVKLSKIYSFKNVRIELIDTYGKKVLSENRSTTNQNLELPLHNIPPGFYLLHIYSAGQRIAGKVVIE